MVNFTIKILSLFKWLFALFGVNYQSLEILIKTKLTIDFRRVPSTIQSTSKKQTFWKQLIIFCFMGLFIGLSFYSIKDEMLQLSFCFSFIMLLLGTTLITEFTSVLFDERDNNIILPLPIDSRTFLASRLLHIQIYISYIVLALALVPSIIIVIKYGVGVFIGFFLALGVTAWITLLFAVLFYFVLAKIFSAERLKNIIAYVQIFIAMLIFGSYQLMPRFMDTEIVQEAAINFRWYTFLFPPIWSAGFVKMFFGGVPEWHTLILFGISLLAAVGGGLLTIRYLSKDFTSILTADNAGSVKAESSKNKIIRKRKLPGWFFSSNIEKAGWDLSMISSKRDRKFKIAVFPSYGFLFVMLFIFFQPDFSDLQGSFREIAESEKYLTLIFISFFGTMAIIQLPYTDTPEASWIYKTLPFTKAKHILSGAFKGMMFKFYLPFYVIIIAISYLVWGYKVLPLIVLGGILVYWVTQLTVIMYKMNLPFTQHREMQSKGSHTVKLFLNMFLIGLVIGVVYLISKLPLWIILALHVPVFAMIPLTFYMMRKH